MSNLWWVGYITGATVVAIFSFEKLKWYWKGLLVLAALIVSMVVEEAVIGA